MCSLNKCGQSGVPDGCKVPVGSGVCGETTTLEIIKQFRRLYEDKMQMIDRNAGGDNLQEKVKLQQEWITDLTEQNEMLVKAVEELEYEATERVQILEDKLQKSAQCICEVMKKYMEHDITNDLLHEPLEKLFNLENNQKNLLEFIRRVRENNEWNTNGLVFYNIPEENLFGSKHRISDRMIPIINNSNTINKMEKKLEEKDMKIQNLCEQVESGNSRIQCMANDMKCKAEECISLQQSMVDMRQALTEEVASKHDVILSLKRECVQLEERCQTLGKQLVFKDDIIKELRKEIKQLKLQETILEDVIRSSEKIKENIAITNDYGKIEMCFEENCNSDNNANENDVDDDGVRLNKIIEVQSNQLREQLELIKTCANYNNEIKRQQNLITTLETKKDCLHQSLNEDKKQIEMLDKEFQTFRQDREELKTKCKEFECRLQCTCAETKKMRNTNKHLKAENAKLIQSAEITATTLQDLTNKNEQAKKQIINLNDENRDLLATIKNLRKKIDCASKCAEAEVHKLNASIDELQNNLNQSRKMQEDEIRKYENMIECLNKEIVELREGNKQRKICKLCKGRSKVGFSDTSNVNADQVKKVSIPDKELIDALKEKEECIEKLAEKHKNELTELNSQICHLQCALADCDGRAKNLQVAVDLYTNSINVLEASEEKYKLEVQQQKMTIRNLQQGLVDAKQKLDELKQHSKENNEEQSRTINILYSFVIDFEDQKKRIEEEFHQLSSTYSNLQELNYQMEIEYCTKLQDIHILEKQLADYKGLLKHSQDQCTMAKMDSKALGKQKRCYEEVLSYFKKEMKIFQKQLADLQEFLTLSNQSADDENSKLKQAYLNAQILNDNLSCQLVETEQKCESDCKKRQELNARIKELEQMLKSKDPNMTNHDGVISNIRKTLECSLKQNEDLHNTIKSLNETITQLQEAVKCYEEENCQSKENTRFCRTKINGCRDKLFCLRNNLEKKTTELLKLEMAYNKQSLLLQETQKQLHEIRDNEKRTQCYLQCTIKELKQKLANSETCSRQVSEECKCLQEKVVATCRRETIKDLELKRYRKIVGELKNTMIELNKNFMAKNICKNEECQVSKNLTKETLGEDADDIQVNCICEVEFYQNIIESLRVSVMDLKQKLKECQQKYQKLVNETKQKDVKLAQISKSQALRDEEYKKLKNEFESKLRKAQNEEKRYVNLTCQFECELKQLREELQAKTLQLNQTKQNVKAIDSCRCTQLAIAQDEVNALKSELNILLKKHCEINCENEKLQNQSIRMQSTVASTEARSQLLKDQLEQYIVELQHMETDKEILMKKNRDLLLQLRAIQSTYNCNTRQQQQRYIDSSAIVKQLESELDDLYYNHNEVCNESMNVVSYVRAWIQEQKKIDQFTNRKQRNYCEVIRQFQQQHEKEVNCKSKKNKVSAPPPTICPRQSMGSLNSQGTSSVDDPDSNCPSPVCSNAADWYSNTFQENDSEGSNCYSEDDDISDDWINKVENLAVQVKKANQFWKNKMNQNCCEFIVSRDNNK